MDRRERSSTLLVGGLAVLVAFALGTVVGLRLGDRNGTTTASTPTETTSPTDLTPATTAPDADVAGATQERPPEPILYVSPSGSDSSDGRSLDTAFRTVGRALTAAVAGDEIRVTPGDYPPVGVSNLDFDPATPVLVRATGPGAVIAEPAFDQRDAMRLDNVRGVRFEDLTFRGGIHGIYLVAVSDLVFENVTVEDVGQEGFQLRDASHDVAIRNSLIQRTGLRPGSTSSGQLYSQFGEGIYVGSANQQDPVRDIEISGNEIAYTTAEAVDVKPGASRVLIHGNRVHHVDTANSGAIVVGLSTNNVHPDPEVVISSNRIWAVTRTSRWQDGNAIVVNAPVLIENNVMYDLQHRGILVENTMNGPGEKTVTIRHNTIFGAGLAPVEIRSGTQATVVMEHNLGPSSGSNLASEASYFVDASSGDFNLVPGVAPVDRATVGLVTVDIDGIDRPTGVGADFGAHEIPWDAPLQPQTNDGGTTTTAPPSGDQPGIPTTAAPSSSPETSTSTVSPSPEVDGPTATTSAGGESAAAPTLSTPPGLSPGPDDGAASQIGAEPTTTRRDDSVVDAAADSTVTAVTDVTAGDSADTTASDADGTVVIEAPDVLALDGGSTTDGDGGRSPLLVGGLALAGAAALGTAALGLRSRRP